MKRGQEIEARRSADGRARLARRNNRIGREGGGRAPEIEPQQYLVDPRARSTASEGRALGGRAGVCQKHLPPIGIETAMRS
jgi:hypothetical protein